MKKSLSLALFLLSSSSLLHAKGGLEQILGGPEQDLHLMITHAIKKQKARVLDEFSGSPALPGLKEKRKEKLKDQYELQFVLIEEIVMDIGECQPIPASSSESSSTSLKNNNINEYNSSKDEVRRLKQKLTPDVKLQLDLSFASLPIEGAPVESVRYGIALKDASSPALESFQTEFHKHDYHQFIEWRNYANYLVAAANDLIKEGNIEKSTEYNKAAFRIYEEILPIEIDVFELLRKKTLPARLYSARTQTTGELGGLLTTDELLETSYYQAGTLALTLGQTESALNFLLLSQSLAKENKIDRPYLPYLIAHEWHNLGGKTRNPQYFRLAVISYDEYFRSNPKMISLDDYIRAAGAALTAEQIDRESEGLRESYLRKADLWMRKVVDTLQVTKESNKLEFQSPFKNNVLELAGMAHKAGDYHGALYFYEAILQNEAILNQPDLSSSIQYYNAGTMAYLAKDYAKARLYLSQVNREDPWVAKDARIGRSIDIWLEEIASPSVSFPSSSVAGPSTPYPPSSAGPSRSYES